MSTYSTGTVPMHLAAFAIVVAWAAVSGTSMRHAIVFASIFFNHIVLEVGVSLRLDYVVCMAATLLYVGSWHARRPVEIKWLAALLVALLVASLASSVAPGYSVRKLAILVIYVVAASVILSPSAHRRPMMEVLGEFLAVGNRVLAVSLLFYVAFLVAGLDVGFIKDRGQAWLRGPMMNPNVFGSTSSAFLVLNGALALRSDRKMWVHAGWTAVSAACVFLSYTRAAWLLAVCAAIALAFWWLLGSGRIRAVHMGLLAGALLVAVAVGPLIVALGFDEKADTLIDITDGTALDRIVLASAGIQDWLSNPILGTGFQSYEFLVGADEDPTVPVPGVLFIQLLQYGGAVTLLCFLGFLYAVHRRIFQALRDSGGMRSPDVLVPLLISLDLLVTAYQVTSAIVLAYFWFFTILIAYLLEERLGRNPPPSDTLGAYLSPPLLES